MKIEKTPFKTYAISDVDAYELERIIECLLCSTMLGDRSLARKIERAREESASKPTWDRNEYDSRVRKGELESPYRSS